MSWTIEQPAAENLRPGMFVYSQAVTAFVEVKEVWLLGAPSSQDRSVFVDLSDGRTLQFAPGTSVFARARR